MGYIDPPPYGINSLKQPFLFEQRLLYKQKSFSRLFDPIPLDVIYEKPFYGKVDVHGTPIYPSEVNMTQLPGDGLILVLDFVAAAFNDFKAFIDKGLMSRQRVFNDLFSSFLPKSGLKSVHQLYQDHFVNNVFNVFSNKYLNVAKINKKVKNFDNFVTEFIHFAHLMVDQFPITKTGFIVSPLCTNAISGLFIELENLPPDNDIIKYTRFLSRPSFNRYLKTAAFYGFYVDKNIPWRLAANMDSQPIKDYMARFGTSLDNNEIFSSYFYKSEYFSYESMKARLWNMYATLIVNPTSATYGTIYEIKNCPVAVWNDVGSNSYNTKIKEGMREGISLNFDEEFTKQYSDEYFLPIYLKLRLAESNIKYNKRQLTSAIKRTLDFYRAYGIEAAANHIGKIAMRTNIYKKIPIDKKAPYRIKYFGGGTPSGLHSYEASDIMKKEDVPKATSTEY